MSLFNRTIFALVLALACNACVFGFDTSFEAGGAGDDADADAGDADTADAADADAADAADAGDADVEPDTADATDAEVDAADGAADDNIADSDIDATDAEELDVIDATDLDVDLDADATDVDATDIDVDTCVENGCGGCTALPTLGALCGPCDLDELVCDGTDAVRCDGATACTGIPLGSACESDTECPPSSWCSTVAGQRRCAPIALSSTSSPMRFVYVPGGTFSMGSTVTSDEQPVHDVTLSAYFVAETEVTQAQWIAIAASNPSYFAVGNTSRPTESVSWYASVAYANALSVREGLPACYAITPSTCVDTLADWSDGGAYSCTGATYVGRSCTGYRLLTEAEWERAARGGTTGTFYWGESTSTSTVGTFSWYANNSGNTTHPVATKTENAFGLYDMSGSVWEWVWDWYGSTYAGFALSPDPVGALSGYYRVFRGGSWDLGPSFLRSATRAYFSTGARRTYDIGFRLARSVP